MPIRQIVFLVAGAVLVAMAISGCGDDSTGTVVLLDRPDDGSPPRYGDAPFPSEAWRGADGTLEPIVGLDAVLPRDADLLATHIASLDGFGVRPLVEFPLSGPLDPAAVPAVTAELTDAAVVLDVDPDSAERGRVLPYEWRYDDDALVVRGSPVPGTVLRPGTLYAAILTTDLRDADGRPIHAASGLHDLLGGDAPAPWSTTAAALAGLAQEEPWRGGERIAGAAVFRTQRALRTLLAARAMLDDPDLVPPAELTFPDPGIIFAGRPALRRLLGRATRFEDGPRAGEERWGMSNETGIAHDHVGVIGTGRISTARFRRPAVDGDGPDDMTFEVDPATGAPVVQSTDSLPITFVLPARPPASEAGYPVAIFGHGLGASRAAVVSFAEPLTRAGYAIVCIDFEQHGSRYNDVDTKNNLGAMIPNFTGESIPDGFGDKVGHGTSFEMLQGLHNLSGARDAIQQSVLDISQVVLLLKRGDYDLAPLAGAYDGVAPKLDASHVAYLGESFGTISGGVLTALEPDVDLFVLDVPGAAVVDLTIVNSPEMTNLLLPLLEVVYGIHLPIDRFDQGVALFQALVDPVDPITWAPYTMRDHLTVGDRQLGPRHVVGLEVVGDEIIPNVATDAWARAMGLQVLTPHMGMPEGLDDVASPASGNLDGQTGVLVHYSPATHGANWTSEWGDLQYEPDFPYEGDDPFPKRPEPLRVSNPIYETLAQVVQILDTHQAGGVPVVTSTWTPSAPP